MIVLYIIISIVLFGATYFGVTRFLLPSKRKRKRSKAKRKKNGKIISSSPNSHKDDGTLRKRFVHSRNSEYTQSKEFEKPIIKKSQKKILSSKSDEEYIEEFKMITKQSRVFAEDDLKVALENSDKNKYSNVLPFDDAVIKMKGDSKFYVNASEMKINGFTYVCAQWPLEGYSTGSRWIPGTVNDFWRLVHYKEIPIIVALQRFNNSKRCSRYWKDSVTDYPEVTVRLLKTNEHDHFVERMFQIFDKIAKTTHKVTHYHYSQWPDFGVPEIDPYITFQNEIISKLRKLNANMILTHCNAGIGRTGVFCTTHNVVWNGFKDIENVPKIVLKERSKRRGMIQTVEQYKFANVVLRKLYEEQL